MLTCVRQSLRLQRRTPFIALRWASSQGQANTSNQSDVRLEHIRRVLFEAPAREVDIELEGEALERHETIERAYKLHTMRERERRQQALERQFRAMNQAMTELEKTSDRLLKAAFVKSRHITYPKQAKVPTETPSPQGWNYTYEAPAQEK